MPRSLLSQIISLSITCDFLLVITITENLIKSCYSVELPNSIFTVCLKFIQALEDRWLWTIPKLANHQQIAYSNCSGGGYLSLVLVANKCATWDFQSRHIYIIKFPRKCDPFINHSTLNSGQNFDQDFQIFLKFELICNSNLGKFWKTDPFIYYILHFTRDHWYTRSRILLPFFLAHSHRFFGTKYPPMFVNVNTL